MPVSSLGEVVSHLRGDSAIEPCPADNLLLAKDSFPYVGPDLSHVRGQETPSGPWRWPRGDAQPDDDGTAGSGKTLLARTMPSVLPAMDPQEALEATKVYSISGMLPSDQPLIRQRPFRSPHYTTSTRGWWAGVGRPDRVRSRWHTGASCFSTSFRSSGTTPGIPASAVGRPRGHHKPRPVERDVSVQLHAAGGDESLPLRFYGDTKKECRCSHSMVSKYQRRISGPLMDRMDMFVEVPAVEYEKLMDDADGETSAQVQSRVEEARAVQVCRFEAMPFTTNSEMGPAEVWDFCQVGQDCQKLLQASMSQLNLSARAFHRVLKPVADDSGPGGFGGHRGAPPGGGAAVPAAVGGLGVTLRRFLRRGGSRGWLGWRLAPSGCSSCVWHRNASLDPLKS